MPANDLDLVRALVEPLASKAGMFRGRVMGMVDLPNIVGIYQAVGEQGIRDAAEAIIRIGKVGFQVPGSQMPSEALTPGTRG